MTQISFSEFWQTLEFTTLPPKKGTALWSHLDKSYGSQSAVKNLGTNGAVQWSASGMGEDSNPLIGQLVALFTALKRGVTSEYIKDSLSQIVSIAKAQSQLVYKNTLVLLITMAFFVRNCRGGKGEKDASRLLLLGLHHYCPKIIEKIIILCPEKGYWKDLSLFIQDLHKYYNGNEHPLAHSIYNIIVEQFQTDLNTFRQSKTLDGQDRPQLSLLVKWIPKEGRSFDKKYHCTREIVRRLYSHQWNDDRSVQFRCLKAFRKDYVMINRAINTVETLMHQGQFAKIKFNLVPGRSLKIHSRAWFNLKGGQKCKSTEARFPDDPDRIKCRENILDHMENKKYTLRF